MMKLTSFTGIIRALWIEIMTPDDHAGRPVAGVIKQFNKVSVGFFASVVACLAYWAVMGEMPLRTVTFGWLVGAYFGLVEIAGQGWKGADTADDTYFFAIGAAGPLVTFHEVETNLGLMFDLYEENAIGALICLVISLIFYGWNKRPIAA
jgi:hypothetical protein